MSNTSLLGSYGDNSGAGLMFRNRIINGNFDIWQRGTTQASMDANFYLADRWRVPAVGSTRTSSRQAFTVGQTDVPGNPEFFHRTVVSSVAGAGNLVVQAQRVENVNTLAGQQATISFWAKADAPKQIALSFIQHFGSGGSPSTVVNTHITKVSLTTSWQLFTVSTTVPSISGKTLGTDGNSYLQLSFWFDAGSSFNAETGSLGQQSGTFDLAQIQMEAGPVATPFERRPIGTELALCQRYYEKSYPLTTTPGTSTTEGIVFLATTSTQSNGIFVTTWPFRVQKRATPNKRCWTSTGTLGQVSYKTGATEGTIAVGQAGEGSQVNVSFFTTLTANTFYAFSYHWDADAEL